MVRVRLCLMIGIRSARWQQPNVPVQPREPLVVDGELLAEFTIDPARNYQPNNQS